MIVLNDLKSGSMLDGGKSIGDKKIGKILEKDGSCVILLGQANQFG